MKGPNGWLAGSICFRSSIPALKEFLTAGHIEERFFVDQFGAEYGMDISDGPEGVYHLFAEACDDYRVLPLQKHLPGGILASAAAFLLKILSSSGLLTTFTKHIKEQVPELPKETYLLDEAGHPAFEDIRQMLEPRGLRIAPLQQVREVDRLIKRLHRCQKNPVERKTALEELVKWVPGLADFFDIFQISDSPLVELDSGSLAAIRSRILAHLSPGNTARRVAIVGYNQNIIAAMRRIGSEYADHIELVVFVGQKPRDIMQWIKYNSQLGSFEEVRGDERGFLYLGKQESAVSIYHGSSDRASGRSAQPPLEGHRCPLHPHQRRSCRKVPGEVFDGLREEGIEIVIARTQTTESQAFLSPIFPEGGGLGQRTWVCSPRMRLLMLSGSRPSANWARYLFSAPMLSRNMTTQPSYSPPIGWPACIRSSTRRIRTGSRPSPGRSD